MPKYTADMNQILTEQEALILLHSAENARDKAIISLMWLHGPRPSELFELQKKDLEFTIKNTLRVTYLTKKLRKKTGYQVTKRTLEVEYTEDNEFISAIRDYYDRIAKEKYSLFHITTARLRQLIEKLGHEKLGRQLCAYNFRHSRLTSLASMGYNEPELMHWKGAASPRSVRMYLHARPFTLKI
jgi:integrase